MNSVIICCGHNASVVVTNLPYYCCKLVVQPRLKFPGWAMPTLIFSRVGACPPCSPRAGAHGRYVWQGGQTENQGGQTKKISQRFAPNFDHPGLKPCRRPCQKASPVRLTATLLQIAVRCWRSLSLCPSFTLVQLESNKVRK